MKVKILMVCLGNICRSPLAEGILRTKLDSQKFEVDSAGTSNYHQGESPDRRSIEIARKNGIDISELKGKQFSISDFDTFDYIFVMDKSNYANVCRLTENEHHHKKVSFLLDALGKTTEKEVPDPYYGDKNGFRAVFAMIDEACEIITEKLNSKHS